MKYIKILLIVVLVTSFFASCNNDEINQSIPKFRVQFELNLNVWDNTLRDPTSYKIFTEPRKSGEYLGYSGLLVVTGLNMNNGIPVLYAYDLTCPQEELQNNRLEVTKDGLSAQCKMCKSVYNIIEGVGNPVSGPSRKNLQQYRAIPALPYTGVFRVVN